jgi:hypothetical protein
VLDPEDFKVKELVEIENGVEVAIGDSEVLLVVDFELDVELLVDTHVSVLVIHFVLVLTMDLVLVNVS